MDDETSSEVARLLKEVQEKDDEIKDLKTIKIALDAKLTQFDELKASVSDWKAKFEEKSKQVIEFEAQLKSKDLEIKELNSSLIEKDLEIDTLEKEHLEVSKLLDEKIKQSSALEQNSSAIIEKLRVASEDLQLENKKMENAANTIMTLETNLKERDTQLQEKLNEIENLNQNLIERDTLVQEKLEAIEKLTKEASNFNDLLEVKESELGSAHAQIENLQTQLDGKAIEITQLNEWNDSKANELALKDDEIKSQTSLIEDLRNQVSELNQTLVSVNNNIAQQLKEIEANKTQFITSVKKYQQAIFDSIKGVQENMIYKVTDYNSSLLEVIQELHNLELDSFQGQATLLNQDLSAFKITEIKPPEIQTTKIIPAKVETAPPSLPIESASEPETPTFAKVEEDTVEQGKKLKKEKPIDSIFLHFEKEHNEFVRVRALPEIGINLILDPKEQKWIMVWSKDAGFVQRRTAERQARSISSAGYSVGKARIGQGFPLEMIGEKLVPSRLLRDQHEY